MILAFLRVIGKRHYAAGSLDALEVGKHSCRMIPTRYYLPLTYAQGAFLELTKSVE